MSAVMSPRRPAGPTAGDGLWLPFGAPAPEVATGEVSRRWGPVAVAQLSLGQKLASSAYVALQLGQNFIGLPKSACRRPKDPKRFDEDSRLRGCPNRWSARADR